MSCEKRIAEIILWSEKKQKHIKKKKKKRKMKGRKLSPTTWGLCRRTWYEIIHVDATLYQLTQPTCNMASVLRFGKENQMKEVSDEG